MSEHENLELLTMSAIQLNEIYESYKNAGFSEWQSFELVKLLLVESLRRQS